MLKVEILTKERYNDWNKYVLSQKDATIFHLTNWMKVIEETYRHEPIYLYVKDEKDNLRGILPLFYIKSPKFFFGKILASCPFTSFGGIIAENEESKSILLKEAEYYSILRNVNYTEIKNKDEIKKLPENWNTKQLYFTLFLDISQGSESVWKNWRDKTRNDVRKAIKSGITIERGKHLLDDFYNIWLIDMKRLGTPPHSKTLFENILKYFPENAEIFAAKLSGKVVGAILALGINGIFHSYASVSLIDYRKQKPNELLYWNIVQYAIDKKYKYLDFGRSTIDSGTFKFKKHLNGEPIPLHYYYYLNKIKKMPNIHQDNKNFKLLINLWQLLPIKMTELVGPHLIKYVV